MSWYEKLYSIATKAHTPFVAILRNQFGIGRLAKEQLYLNAYKGWVFACVNVIAEEVGAMQLRLLEGIRNDEEEDEEVFDHPALNLLREPNGLMTQADLFGVLSSHLDLDGNAFWYIAKNEKGQPVEIYPLRPDKTHLIQSETEPLEVSGYLYQQEDGTRVPLDPSEIIHFKNFNPAARYPFPDRGKGIVESAEDIIDTDDFSRQWGKNFYLNSARPEGILQYDGDISEDEYKRLKEQWNSQHQGIGNSNKTAILKGGMTYVPISLSQKEMDFIESRRFTRDEILAMWRVPKTILGIVEDVNRANAEASNVVFGQRVLTPRFRKIVEMLNMFYLPMFKDGTSFYLNFDSPVPEDRKGILEEYSMGLNKWLTRNDIRAKEGLSPTQDGDVFMGSLAEFPVDAIIQEDVQEEREKPRVKIQLKNLKDKKSKFDKEFIAPTDQAIKHFGVLLERTFIAQGKALVKQFSKGLEEKRKRVIENLHKELEGLDNSEYKLKDVDLFYNVEAETEETKELTKAMMRVFAKDSSNNAFLLVKGVADSKEDKAKKPRKVPDSQIVDEVDLDTPEFQKFIDERAEFFARRTNEQIRDDLFHQIELGFEKGESLEKIEERVANAIGKRRASRTKLQLDTIARTETSALQQFVNEQAYKQSGIVKHRWEIVTPKDAQCLKANKEVRGIGKSFTNGLIRPPVHPNCNCFTVPVK